MINASDSEVGQQYKTPSGILIEIVEKRPNDVLIKSFETEHIIPVTFDYKLRSTTDKEVLPPVAEMIMEEKIMSSDTVALPTEAPKTRKLKKSNIVDEGLRSGLSVEEITKNVLATFPETPEKSVRNLVSVRRSKLKKTT